MPDYTICHILTNKILSQCETNKDNMKKIAVWIKAILVVILGACVYAIMAVSVLLYGIWSGLKKMKVTKNEEPESPTHDL